MNISPDHRVDVDLRHIVSPLTTKLLSLVDQHSSGISSSCGETILYQWDSLSFPPQVSLHWSSNIHQIASLGDSMLCFSFQSLDTGFPVLVRSKFEIFVLSVPGCEVHSEPSAVGDRSTVVDTKFHIGFDFATTRSSSPGLSCGLRPEVARCKLCTVHVIEQTEKVIALFKGENCPW